MIIPLAVDTFLETVVEDLIRRCHGTAVDKGWWDNPRTHGECIALMHSELSEALKALRTNANDDKLPQYKGVEIELADLLIRVFDYCGKHDLRLGEALLAKMEYNKTRPYKHGKAF